MKKLFAFEMRKVWRGRWFWVPVALVLIVALWLFVVSPHQLDYVLSGQLKAYNEATSPYWGMVVTDELKQRAHDMAIFYGAQEDASGYLSPPANFTEMDPMDQAMSNFWRYLVFDPTMEEALAEKAFLDENVRWLYEEGRISETAYKMRLRASDPPPKQILPGNSAWSHFFQFENYPQVLAGLALLALLLVFLSDIFSGEESGGLSAVCLTKPLRRQWILSKILVSALTGTAIAFALYAGLLLVFGLIYGFSGWNMSPVNYFGGGYNYGILNRSCTCLSLALSRLFLITLSGAFLGMLLAALSALLRRGAAAAGAFLLSVIGMEALLYGTVALQQKWVNAWFAAEASDPSHPLPWHMHLDWDLIHSLASTPVRMFWNVESLTWRFTGSLTLPTNEILPDIMVTPDLWAWFVGLTLAAIALCAALCFTFARRR